MRAISFILSLYFGLLAIGPLFSFHLHESEEGLVYHSHQLDDGYDHWEDAGPLLPISEGTTPIAAIRAVGAHNHANEPAYPATALQYLLNNGITEANCHSIPETIQVLFAIELQDRHFKPTLAGLDYVFANLPPPISKTIADSRLARAPPSLSFV